MFGFSRSAIPRFIRSSHHCRRLRTIGTYPQCSIPVIEISCAIWVGPRLSDVFAFARGGWTGTRRKPGLKFSLHPLAWYRHPADRKLPVCFQSLLTQFFLTFCQAEPRFRGICLHDLFTSIQTPEASSSPISHCTKDSCRY